MASGRRSSIEAPIRTLWTVGAVGEAADAELLSLFTDRRADVGEEAFRVLVERHGPMVLRVCKQVLADRQTAEDAAQAVFMVLARKASRIRVDGSVAPWLHGVARRVAAKARGRSAVRRELEHRTALAAAEFRRMRPEGSATVEDWETIHEEVHRLPEKYRTAVVLCYLQGLTYEETARRLGCPVGTVRVRLSRARDRLRERLARRGFGPESFGETGWPGADADSMLPPVAGVLSCDLAWRESTIQALRAFSPGGAVAAGTVPAAVLELYDGVTRAMLLSQWKFLGAWVLAVGMAVVGVGAVGFASSGPRGPEGVQGRGPDRTASEPLTKEDSQPPLDLDSPDTFAKHLDRQLKAARQRLEAQRAYYEEGRITIDRMIEASRQVMLVETVASKTKEERVAAARAHYKRMVEIFNREQAELKIGKGTEADIAEAALAVENAGVEYLQARQSPVVNELEAMRNRVDALEKQLEKVMKRLEERDILTR